MNRNVIKIIFKIIAFLICLGLIIAGNLEVGRLNFGIMLIGLAGLLVLLYDYNRKFI